MSSLTAAREGVVSAIQEVVRQEIQRSKVYAWSMPGRNQGSTGARLSAETDVELAVSALNEAFALYEQAIKESTEL